MLSITVLSFGQNVFISEINYTGATKGIRLTGNGTVNLDGWEFVFYKRANGKVYEKISTPIELSGTLNNSEIWFDIPEMSNVHGQGMGVALIDADGGFIELVGYNGPDGEFEAKDGPAAGKSSTYAGKTTGESSLQRPNPDGNWNSNPPINQRTASVTKNQIDGFNVYPNPVREGLFSISTKNSFEKHVIIYSILGSVVYEKTVGANELVNVKNLSVGMYLVQVEEDEKVSIKKLLIN